MPDLSRESYQTIEHDVLEALAPKLRADGFNVIFRPGAEFLPPFMGQYRPDAIALKPDKRVAIEVVRRGPQAPDKLRRLSALFDDQAEWELRIYAVGSVPGADPAPTIEHDRIAVGVAALERLSAAGDRAAALLIGWGALEAAARRQMPEKFARIQPAGHLVERMAHEGVVVPDDADFLRDLAPQRDLVAHGDLDLAIDPADLARLATIIREILAETNAEAEPAPPA